MGEISVSDIVFVTFPFSDLSQTKLRPALVLANAQRNDWILCQITSQSYYDTQAITIDVADYREGFLSQVSYVRPHKIFQLVPTRCVGTECGRASVPLCDAGASSTAFPRGAWERDKFLKSPRP